jgi:hypothetical protein
VSDGVTERVRVCVTGCNNVVRIATHPRYFRDLFPVGPKKKRFEVDNGVTA